jgi:hypothetical protein
MAMIDEYKSAIYIEERSWTAKYPASFLSVESANRGQSAGVMFKNQDSVIICQYCEYKNK